ncbi:MAG: hypothetical protein K2M50_02280 [Treponemataceae bacterium]|nr:hypothetical protein [Treponemataceae bacterium]
MNCKFHPTEEAVTTCAACGAGMCSSCENGAFFFTKEDEPFCLECSLKEAEERLEKAKQILKDTKRSGIIATIIWIIGACLLPVSGGFSFIIMLGAAIFFYGAALLVSFSSEENGFFEKIKGIIIGVVFNTLLLPIMFIWFLISDKLDVKRAEEKLEKIKVALGNAN